MAKYNSEPFIAPRNGCEEAMSGEWLCASWASESEMRWLKRICLKSFYGRAGLIFQIPICTVEPSDIPVRCVKEDNLKLRMSSNIYGE